MSVDAGMKFERDPAADLWRRTLAQIPTTIGKLVYLSSLREPNSGQYRHYGLAQRFSDQEADEALRESHDAVFGEWLEYGLERQKSELDEYLAGLEENVAQVVATWIRLAPYRNLVPARAREVERTLFLSDLETLLDILRHEHGVSLPDPDA